MLERLEEQPKRAAGRDRERATPFVEADRARPQGLDRAVQPDHPPRRGGRPGRPARLRAAPSSPGCSSAPTAPTTATLRIDGAAGADAHARVAAMGHDIAFCSENRRTEGLVEDLTVRENIILALQAARGWARPMPAPSPGRAGRQVHQGAAASARPTPSCRCATSVRRQPAEGPAGPLADHRAAAADPRRADPRHRRRREGRDPAAGGRARPTAAWPCCSSPPSWRRCCGSATRSRVLRDRQLVAELANDDDRRRRPRHADHRERSARMTPLLAEVVTRHHLFWPAVVLVAAARRPTSSTGRASCRIEIRTATSTAA